MGYDVPSQTSYQAAVSKHIGSSGNATKRGYDEVQKTGKLHHLVDPSADGVIRLSKPRFELLPNGLFKLTIGTPIEKEDHLDTTGSMQDNVAKAIKVLPNTYELCSKMLPGYDLQIAIGIFGDCGDDYVVCRPQFEMTAEKLVDQLTLMNPEGLGGGNGGEDPHYALFGSAYLTSARSNLLGLKGYDFTISDEPARYTLEKSQLTRIFGDEVFQKTAENGFGINPKNLPDTKEVVQNLLKRAHAFFLQVGDGKYDCHEFWTEMYGAERVIVLSDITLLPQIESTIIGLTEGTLGMGDVIDFLIENKVPKITAKSIARSVSNIPIGAQTTLRKKIIESGHQIPKKGDLFRSKTDLWPIDSAELASIVPENQPVDPVKPGVNWL